MGAGQVMDRGVAAEAVTIKAPASAWLPAASTAATSTRATPSRTTRNSTRRATGINSPSLPRDPHVSRGQANMLDRPILLVKTPHSLSQNRTKGRSFTQEGITPKRDVHASVARSPQFEYDVRYAMRNRRDWRVRSDWRSGLESATRGVVTARAWRSPSRARGRQ